MALWYPCSTELLAHPSLVRSKVYFFWSPTEDYCVTVWWIWFVFVDYQVSVRRVGRDLMRQKCPDDGTKCRSDTDLIVDKHKSDSSDCDTTDSSDCDTTVFRKWPEEINLASDEWRMSQKLCGTGILDKRFRKCVSVTACVLFAVSRLPIMSCFTLVSQNSYVRILSFVFEMPIPPSYQISNNIQ